MKSTIAPIAVIALGLILLVLSWFWPAIVGGANAYTEADHQQYEKARENVLATMHSHNGGEAAEHETSTSAAEAEFAAAQAKLDAAKSKGKGAAVVLKWAGIVLVVVGAVAHFAVRTS